MRAVDIIEKKKQGLKLSNEEINFIVSGYVDGSIPDYQMSVFCMAILFKGMDMDETVALTKSMLDSGEVYDLSVIEGVKVDKHSTGGIGDKVSLILGPIVAACGVKMAKMSGRALGFTGGTIDKLESIKGFNVNISFKKVVNQVEKTNLAIIAQSEKIVPADKKIYALRDVTATVDSIPLIASSIMSKKLATGSDVILLDVKCGRGAFIKDIKTAEILAKTMIDIGRAFKRIIRVEITSMEEPLGQAIGNRNEVVEAMNFLKNVYQEPHLKEVIYSSCATLLVEAKKVKNEQAAIKLIDETISSGKAYETFLNWIHSQGGDISLLQSEKYWRPKYTKEIFASKNGYFEVKDALVFAQVSMLLGAGREKKGDPIDFEAGINLYYKTGNEIKSGDKILTMYSSKPIDDKLIDNVKLGYDIVNTKKTKKLILERI